MMILKRSFVLWAAWWGLILGLMACDGQPGPVPDTAASSDTVDTVASPTPEEQDVVTVRYPNLSVSANGTTALLDTVNQGFQVYAVPDLTLQVSQNSYENIYNANLSSSGTTVGVWKTTGELVVMQADASQTYKLPYDRPRIRGLAVADAGDRVALLVASENQARLEIWSLPPGDSPLAGSDIPLFEGGVVSANGDLSRLAVRYSNDQFSGVYTWTEGNQDLAALWEETDPNHSPTDLLLYNDWVWAVQDAGPLGWQGADAPVQLPGNLRDRLRFSPTGSHLLVYRVEKNVDVTTAELLFRLFDLESATEVKQATHVIEDNNGVAFALSSDLALFELRATREAKLEIKELGW